MSKLKKSQRILSGLNLFGNFLEKPLRIGDIVLSDRKQHILWGNIEDVVDGFSLQGKIREANKANLKYTSDSAVDVNISLTADSTVAQGEILLTFNRMNSAFVVLNQIKQSSVKLALIEKELKSYWAKQGFNDQPSKYHFVISIIEAESGTVIYSHSKENRVVIKGKNNIPLTSIATTGDGKVEFVRSTKSTLEIISETKIQPLYQAVKFKSNGRFVLVG